MTPHTDPLSPDSDGDHMPDAPETQYTLDPLTPDADARTRSNGLANARGTSTAPSRAARTPTGTDSATDWKSMST
ncbi:MAG: hypothetical protein U1F77_01385 [Kiritimatiellia bacterium]